MAEKMKPRTIVRATTHPSDSRPNIPTAELESFARPEEKRPAIVRYPLVITILDNLRRAGVQNTKRDERLEFTRLEPYPGVFVQAMGERRAAQEDGLGQPVHGLRRARVSSAGDGLLTVEVCGLDVYDPTTGVLRSSSVEDGSLNEIAAWFLDTDYNGEAFIVRHAYFTGAGDPYAQLKRALKADVDEEAWASLYQTRSRPFDVPDSGRIAVKVINHYGDEVLKTYEV